LQLPPHPLDGHQSIERLTDAGHFTYDQTRERDSAITDRSECSSCRSGPSDFWKDSKSETVNRTSQRRRHNRSPACGSPHGCRSSLAAPSRAPCRDRQWYDHIQLPDLSQTLNRLPIIDQNPSRDRMGTEMVLFQIHHSSLRKPPRNARLSSLPWRLDDVAR
jgi:hypothetical protein